MKNFLRKISYNRLAWLSFKLHFIVVIQVKEWYNSFMLFYSKTLANIYHWLYQDQFFVIKMNGRFWVLNNEWRENYNRRVIGKYRVKFTDLLQNSIYITKKY